MPPESRVRQIKIMISSTRADLAQYRDETRKIIDELAKENQEQVQIYEESMEEKLQTGDLEQPVAVSRGWVEKADWVVLIIGFNYGTISREQGCEGLSITEWEFKYAHECKKRVFVFMAGDPDATEEYRVSQEEQQDLKNWQFKKKQTEDQMNKIEAFRMAFNQHFVNIFANLAMFRTKLRSALRVEIARLSPRSVQRSEVILEMRRKIYECNEKVKLINEWKRIHDQLHQLYQLVIRQLREAWLPLWEQNGKLYTTVDEQISGLVKFGSERLEDIKRVTKSIMKQPNTGDIASELSKLWLSRLWDVRSDSNQPRPSRGEFNRHLSKFAKALQSAFTESDEIMKKEEGNLRPSYEALVHYLTQVKRECNLDSLGIQRLDAELNRIRGTRERLGAALEVHHSWQTVHDQLHYLQSLSNDPGFPDELKDYCEGKEFSNLRSLVQDERRKAEHHNPVRPRTLSENSTEISGGLPQDSSTFVDKFECLEDQLTKLCEAEGKDAFNKMRKLFDDAFFTLDKRTLDEVCSAEDCASNLQRWLDDLDAQINN